MQRDNETVKRVRERDRCRENLNFLFLNHTSAAGKKPSPARLKKTRRLLQRFLRADDPETLSSPRHPRHKKGNTMNRPIIAAVTMAINQLLLIFLAF